jgi:hypothetical protein
MRTRADYDQAFAVVREVIHEWDPYGLLAGGAPKDEWDDEIAKLLTKIPHIASEADAIDAVSSVFTAAFEPEEFSTADCAAIGRRLYQSLTVSELLSRKP